jgi:hypothetical protein
VKELNDIHRRILQKVAEGLTNRTEIAKEVGWHRGSVSRFLAKPEARAELLRLREEAERQFAERLPDLITKALNALESALDSRNDPHRRLKAATFVLSLAERLNGKAELNSAGVTYDVVPVEQEPADPQH